MTDEKPIDGTGTTEDAPGGEDRPGVQTSQHGRGQMGFSVRSRRMSRMAMFAGLLAVSNAIMTSADLVHRIDYWKYVYLVDGLAALVVGIVARHAVRNTQWRARGSLLAWVGIVVGAFALIVAPATAQVKETAKRSACGHNLRQIAIALQLYADDNDGVFPENFLQLYQREYTDNPKHFSCQSEPSQYTDFKSGAITEKSSSYTYVPGLNSAMPGDFIVAYDKSPDNHRKQGYEGGRNVLFADSHVDWWPPSREAEFQKLLAEQSALAERWRKAHRNNEKKPTPPSPVSSFPPEPKP